MDRPGKKQNLDDCLTSEEMAQLFDKAFAMWQACRRDPEGRRMSPRIPTGLSKPVFVDSYKFEGRKTALNRRAQLVDVSADGLGMMLSEPLPVGAALQFAFATGTGEQSQGVAGVVSSAKHNDGFRIGLIFSDTAQSLDVGQHCDEPSMHAATTSPWRRDFARLQNAASVAFHTILRRNDGHRELRRSEKGRDVLFVVDAKLFRYSACMYVDGRRIARRSGVLRDRVRSLFLESSRATVTYLEGGGYYASAVMQPNSVIESTLEVMPRRLHVSFPPIPNLPIPLPSRRVDDCSESTLTAVNA